MKKIICFGEVLWDLLPSGNIPGGAPMNVAVHLNNFGVSSQIISRVGNGNLGAGLVDFLNDVGVNTSLVQIDENKQTSLVKIFLKENNDVSYDILRNVAWDYIEYNKDLEKAVKEANCLAFGSLAVRNARTRNTLLELLPHAKMRVFDVNLRPPFYSKDIIESLLVHTDILKINHEELEEIGGWYVDSTNEKVLVEALKKRFDLKMVCLTRGKDGAILFTENETIETGGYSVKVKDTVGSGDAFLAGFLMKMTDGKSLKEALQFACGAGSLVATHSGAVPKISEEAVLELINKENIK
jgi:fructokinase